MYIEAVIRYINGSIVGIDTVINQFVYGYGARGRDCGSYDINSFEFFRNRSKRALRWLYMLTSHVTRAPISIVSIIIFGRFRNRHRQNIFRNWTYEKVRIILMRVVIFMYSCKVCVVKCGAPFRRFKSFQICKNVSRPFHSSTNWITRVILYSV